MHWYLPGHFAGSETMAHAMAKRLQNENTHVQIYTTAEKMLPESWVYDGVEVVNIANKKPIDYIQEIGSADLLITHHQNAEFAGLIQRFCGTKTAVIIHNEMAYSIGQIRDYPWDLVIYNTEWVKKACEQKIYKEISSIVLHPPVDIDSMKTKTTGEYITLVNLNEHKGSGLFYELAERLPQFNFLGVQGGHGEQVIKDLPNVTIIGQTKNMRDDVYAKSKIVLMPSLYESYGMVSVEAMASGIPVIADPTPGLVEAMGNAGTYINRGSVTGYENVLIDLMQNSRYYNYRSLDAINKAEEIKARTEEEFNRFVSTVETITE